MTPTIMTAIDSEIARLTRVRDLLAGSTALPAKRYKQRRTISSEGRNNMAAAQKLRWAKARQQ